MWFGELHFSTLAEEWRARLQRDHWFITSFHFSVSLLQATKMKRIDKLCIVLLIVVGCGLGISSQTTEPFLSATNPIPQEEIRYGTCRFAPGLTVGDEPRVMECCNRTIRSYQLRWALGQAYLTAYLQSLSSWGCPQFEEQCNARLYAVNEFTGLVYDYFCNVTEFRTKCFQELNATIDADSDETIDRDWSDLIKQLNPGQLSLDQRIRPCIQVALYEAEGEHFGDYHEIIRLNLPSCQPTWCGIDGETLRSTTITAWICMPNR